LGLGATRVLSVAHDEADDGISSPGVHVHGSALTIIGDNAHLLPTAG